MKKYVWILSVFILAACDSGGDAVEADSGIQITGAVAGSVENIAYTTEKKAEETKSLLRGAAKRTNEKGEFLYAEGETITFSIGDISLPTTDAKEHLTLLDIFAVDDPTDAKVVNATQLLLSLDKDGNPDNGINILDETHSAAKGVKLDFASEGFDTDPSVTNLVANSGSVTTTLVDEKTATNYVTEQANSADIVGSWYIKNANGNSPNSLTVISFLADGSFYHGEQATVDTCGQDGLEKGTYTFDKTTRELVVTIDATTDTNGCWGFSDTSGKTLSAEVSENSLTINDSTSFTRADDGSSVMTGGWFMSLSAVPGGHNFTWVMLPDKQYILLRESSTTSDKTASALVRGTYTWDGTNFVETQTVRSDGNALQIENWTMTIGDGTFTGSTVNDQYTFTKIQRY